MKKFELTITQADADNSKEYLDTSNCLIGTAVQRQLNLLATQINVSGFDLKADGKGYRLGTPLFNFVRDFYYPGSADKPVSFPSTFVLEPWGDTDNQQ